MSDKQKSLGHLFDRPDMVNVNPYAEPPLYRPVELSPPYLNELESMRVQIAQLRAQLADLEYKVAEKSAKFEGETLSKGEQLSRAMQFGPRNGPRFGFCA